MDLLKRVKSLNIYKVKYYLKKGNGGRAKAISGHDTTRKRSRGYDSFKVSVVVIDKIIIIINVSKSNNIYSIISYFF